MRRHHVERRTRGRRYTRGTPRPASVEAAPAHAARRNADSATRPALCPAEAPRLGARGRPARRLAVRLRGRRWRRHGRRLGASRSAEADSGHARREVARVRGRMAAILTCARTSIHRGAPLPTAAHNAPVPRGRTAHLGVQGTCGATSEPIHRLQMVGASPTGGHRGPPLRIWGGRAAVQDVRCASVRGWRCGIGLAAVRPPPLATGIFRPDRTR